MGLMESGIVVMALWSPFKILEHGSMDRLVIMTQPDR